MLTKFFLSILSLGVAAFAFAGENYTAPQPAPAPVEQNSHDIFSVDSSFTLSSDFQAQRLGHGNSLYSDFSYDHRFLVSGHWYFRLGMEYERFDFGGTDNGLPDHLQAAYAHVAYEYVIEDHAGAGIEFDPGAFFQDKVTSDAIDVPCKIFVTFPLKHDKIFAVIGLGTSLYQDPIVAPGGGIIWLFNDKLRLEGVFPKPAFVYEATDNLQLRLLGNLNYDSFRTDDVVTTEKRLNLHHAVVEYSEIQVGGQARYSGFKPFNLYAGAGYTLSREFNFFRADQRAKMDGAPYFRLGIEARF